jgi:hypothetical protein
MRTPTMPEDSSEEFRRFANFITRELGAQKDLRVALVALIFAADLKALWCWKDMSAAARQFGVSRALISLRKKQWEAAIAEFLNSKN